VNKGEYAPRFVQTYAEFKAKGEKAVREACSEKLMTIAVAPHQVYGPRDSLFLPQLLGAASEGKLRVFGKGDNQISVTHVDNYCHGLILGAEVGSCSGVFGLTELLQALYPGSPALAKFYIVTDGPPVQFWRFLDEAVVGMELPSLFSKTFLPTRLMLFVGWLSENLGKVISFVTGNNEGDSAHHTPYHIFRCSLSSCYEEIEVQRVRGQNACNR
jgi:nucleoside-diphosphate-sugar epimerase